MLKKGFKKFIKNNRIIFSLISNLIYFYLRFVYLTTKWQIILPDNLNKNEFLQQKKTIFTVWHDQLAFCLKPFYSDDNVYALASSHSDGKIIGNIVKYWGYNIIEGSSNRNPTNAVRRIIEYIGKDKKIVITPDGPRGPRHQINSIITKIAKKYNARLIPMACSSNRYFSLNSWDQMLIPLPFGKVVVIIGNAIKLGDNEEQNNLLLMNELDNLSSKAAKILKILR